MNGFSAGFLKFSLAGAAVLALGEASAEAETLSYRLFASDFSRASEDFADVDKITGVFTLDCEILGNGCRGVTSGDIGAIVPGSFFLSVPGEFYLGDAFAYAEAEYGTDAAGDIIAGSRGYWMFYLSRFETEFLQVGNYRSAARCTEVLCEIGSYNVLEGAGFVSVSRVPVPATGLMYGLLLLSVLAGRLRPVTP